MKGIEVVAKLSAMLTISLGRPFESPCLCRDSPTSPSIFSPRQIGPASRSWQGALKIIGFSKAWSFATTSIFCLLSVCVFAGEDITHLSLDQAETIALQRNRNIHLTAQEVGQYVARKNQSIASWFPEVSFSSMYTMLQKKQSLLLGQGSTRFFVNQFQLNQPIFSTDLIFGMRTAKLQWKSIQSDQNTVVNDTLYQVRSLYYLVALKELSLKTQEEVVGYLSNALENEQKKLDAGRSIQFEVNQDKVAVSQAVSSYHSLVKDLQSARSQLALTLGIDPLKEKELGLKEVVLPIETFPELQNKLSLLEAQSPILSLELHASLFPEEEIQEWISIAKSRRPEVKKSEILVQAAKEEVYNRKGRYLPTISAFVDYGYYLPLNGLFIRQQNNFAGGFQLNWNIFDSFKREYQVKEASYLQNATHIELAQQLDKISVEVRSLIYQIEEALFAYSSAKAALGLALEAMQEAKVRLNAGTITSLEYRDATRAYAEAHRQHDQTRYTLLQSYFQLRHDTGIDI